MRSNEEWFEAMKAKGHTPKMDDWGDIPDIDMFVVDAEFHNGPGCETCGWSCCMHCNYEMKIPNCAAPLMIAHTKD